MTKDLVEKYMTEPYVIAADIYSNENFPGRGGWTWYTGSSAWFYRVALVNILGFNKIGNKLYMLPGMPSKWETYKITYKYGKSVYVINVNNHKDKYEIRHDGKVVKEIELIDDGKTHNINVNVGKEV
jgi:cyclic beta-1,2-glucan synthetase